MRAENLILTIIDVLNGNWPAWVGNVANVVQITGGLAAVVAIVTRRRRPQRKFRR
jgi:hypothetical protein